MSLNSCFSSDEPTTIDDAMIREVLGYVIVERTEGKSVTSRNHGSNDDGEKATKLITSASFPVVHIFPRLPT